MIISVCRNKTYTDVHTHALSLALIKMRTALVISLKHVAVNGYLCSHVVDRHAVIMHAQKMHIH